LRQRWIIAIAVAATLGAPLAIDAVAEPPLETASVETLPAPTAHWIWVPDRLLNHSMLFDGDSGEVLGMIDSAAQLTPKPPLLSRRRGEFYSADIAYSRGLRGERIDFVSIYDARTLSVSGEVMLPTRSAESNASLAYVELLGDRFVAVFNQFPNASVSIVDVASRSFVGAVAITGCAGIYPVSGTSFATLCGNGSAMLVQLDESGHKIAYVASEKFFDVVEDPVFMAAGRDGTRWTFVSFEGQVHTVEFAGNKAEASAGWSLLDAAERRDGWRPGGLQHVALHASTGRLFVGMHEGGPGTHKDAASEIWVWNLPEQKRLSKLELPNLTAAFLGPFLDLPKDSFIETLVGWVVPPGGVHALTVSQDDAPLLFVRNAQLGAVAVMDADTGETLRFLTEVGLAGPTLRVP
jgi:methylamine dehydrogenase heavy chain